MNKANSDVKMAVFASGVKMWQIARKLNIGEATLSRWLRFDMPPEKKARIFEVIEEIKTDNTEQGV